MGEALRTQGLCLSRFPAPSAGGNGLSALRWRKAQEGQASRFPPCCRFPGAFTSPLDAGRTQGARSESPGLIESAATSRAPLARLLSFSQSLPLCKLYGSGRTGDHVWAWRLCDVPYAAAMTAVRHLYSREKCPGTENGGLGLRNPEL